MIEGDLLDSGDRHRLAACFSGLDDRPGPVWEDVSLSGTMYRYDRGTLHVSPAGLDMLRAWLESRGVNPADRDCRRSDFN